MTIVHTGGGVFIDPEPVAKPEGGIDEDAHIYAYATFRSLEHVAYGLYRTTGGPEDEEISSKKVGEYRMTDPLAMHWELDEAISELNRESGSRRERRLIFEEVPFVEVTDEDHYVEALKVLGLDGVDSAWDKPGLYDFRDDPPSYTGTVEQYELDEMQREADDALDSMFQEEDWEEAYRELAAEKRVRDAARRRHPVGGVKMTRIVRDDGIRSYGPGKFYTIIDSYAYGMTLDGGADEEASYGEGGGWYGLLWIDKGTRDAIQSNMTDDGDSLTKEEEELLAENVAVIFFERSDGIVEADWFDNKKKAEHAWAEILVDTEGEEEDESDEYDDEEEAD